MKKGGDAWICLQESIPGGSGERTQATQEISPIITLQIIFLYWRYQRDKLHRRIICHDLIINAIAFINEQTQG